MGRRYQVEGLWDCKGCDRPNLGRDKNCAGCGKGRQDEKSYLPGDFSYEARVRDYDLIRLAQSGADFTCPYCGAKEWNALEGCRKCGALKPRTKESPRVQASSAEEAGRSASSSRDAAGEPIRSHYPQRRYASVDLDDEPVMPVRKDWQKVTIIVLAIAAIVALLYFLFRSEDKTVTLVSVQWTHTTQIECYTRSTHEGFEEDKSMRAENVRYLGMRDHPTEKVECGTTLKTVTSKNECGVTNCRKPPTRASDCKDLGNGLFDCKEPDEICDPATCQIKVTKHCPASREYFAWDEWDWRHARDKVLTGLTIESPRWPTDDELALNTGVGGYCFKERKGAERTSYSIAVKDETGKMHPSVGISTLREFQSRPVGSTHPAKYSLARGIYFP